MMNNDSNIRFRNKYNHKIGRIVDNSLTYDDGTFEIYNNDIEILPEVNHNKLSISEQENFMHLLYDIIHIGVSLESLQIKLDTLNNDFDLKYLLNTKMKNEKYSNSYEYPISKVLNQDRSLIFNDSDQIFYERKLNVIKILFSNGAKIIDKYNFDIMKQNNLINDSIERYVNMI